MSERARLHLWIIASTDKAYLFSKLPQSKSTPADQVWVPRSMVERITKFREVPGQWSECEAEIEEWFAEKKNLL